jgi:surface-associated protein cshB (fragment)
VKFLKPFQVTATITNERGNKATITADAKYTPTVLSAAPTATSATSNDIQGTVQTGTPTFEGATVNVNGQDKQIPLKENSYKLLDKDGNEVIGITQAYAEDGKTPIGTSSIDSTTGVVIFTPTDKTYTGDVVAVKVQVNDAIGTPAETTYTPKITPVPTPDQKPVLVTKEATFINPSDETAVLPETGTEESSKTGLALLSALAGLSLFGLAKRKKED